MSAAALRKTGPYCSDDTAPRIRAFLLSMRPLRGMGDVPDDDPYHRGRRVIERMADTAPGLDMPKCRLSLQDCADVMGFLALSEPVKPGTWWRDPRGSPSHLVGFQIVMQTIEKALGRKAAA
jgi:hypothetical protein